MNKIKTLSFLILIFSVFTFTACDNFFSNNLIQEELQALIDEANAPEVDIYISADADTGTVAPNGIVTHKVGKSFPVIFTEAKDYQFLYWEVIDKDSKASVNSISIDNENETETRFTVLADTKNMLLHPVCAKRPGITSFTPQNTEAGVTKDSSIIITFNKNLSKDNDFSKIAIKSNNVSIAEYYKKPVLNENILTFATDKNNLINVDGIKRIDVTIPADFYYEENGKKITIGTENTFTYRINNSTNINESITFGVSNEKGKITPEGQQEIKIGETITIKFEPKSGYNFTGWNILDGDGKAVSDSVLKVADKSAATTTLTVLAPLNGVSIAPKTYLTPAVSSTSPKQDANNVDCDSKISIVFNKPMKASSFKDYSSASAISITSKGVDVSEYYELPSLSADGKTLTLTPKPGEISNIFNGTDSVDVIYTIKKSAADNVEGEGYGLPDDYLLNVKLKTTRETVKPVFEVFNIAKTREDAINGTNLLTQKDFETFTTDDSNSNYVKNMWIYCKAKDTGGPIKSLITEETLIQTLDERTVSEKTHTSTEGFGSFTNIGNGFHETIFQFTPETSQDGVVHISFKLCDYAGNKSEGIKTYDVIKDTQVSLYFFKVESPKPSLDVRPVNNIIVHNFVITKTGMPNPRPYLKNQSINKNFYFNVYACAENNIQQTVYSYYGDFSDITKMQVPVTRDITKDLILKISLTDEIGNSVTQQYIFDKAKQFLSCYITYENNLGKINIIFPSKNGYHESYDYYGYWPVLEYTSDDKSTTNIDYWGNYPEHSSQVPQSINLASSKPAGYYSLYGVQNYDDSPVIFGVIQGYSNYTYHWNGTTFDDNNPNIHVTEADLPDFEISTELKNNKLLVHTKTIGIFIPKEGVTYLVKSYCATDLNCPNRYMDDFDFYLDDNGKEYTISIVGIDPNGKMLETTKKLTINSTGESDIKTPFFSIDNKYILYPNKIAMACSIGDWESGLTGTFNYYYIPIYTINKISNPYGQFYEQSYIKTFASNEYRFTTYNTVVYLYDIEINYDDLDEINYHLIFEISDKVGNTCCHAVMANGNKALPLSNIVHKKSPDIIYEKKITMIP